MLRRWLSKKNIAVSLVILFFSAISGAVVYYYSFYKLFPQVLTKIVIDSEFKKTYCSSANMGVNCPPPKSSFRPIPYDLREPLPVNSKLSLYRDSQLGISFYYLSNYLIKPIQADANPLEKKLFIWKKENATVDRLKRVDDWVKCESNPNNTTCGEGMMAEIEIRFEEWDGKFDKEKIDEDCRLSSPKREENKIILSCLIGNIAGYPSSRYEVYYRSASVKPLHLVIDTDETYNHLDLALSLIDSLK